MKKIGPSIDFAGRPHRAPFLDVNDSFGSLTCGGIGERNSQRNASSSLQCQSLCVSPPCVEEGLSAHGSSTSRNSPPHFRS